MKPRDEISAEEERSDERKEFVSYRAMLNRS